jgi:hypothetical protein
MYVRGIVLTVLAVFSVGLIAESAEADHHKKPRRIIIEDEYYPPGPPIIRHVPGLRIFFGDYALSEEEFDELYGNGRRVYRDEDEYDRVAPKRKSVEREKKKPAKKTTAKPAKPTRPDAQNGAEQKKTASKAQGLSCDKATSVVSGYGFSSVTPSSCSGKVYAFNAMRDGKSFAIKLDSASGELTEVKKLP